MKNNAKKYLSFLLAIVMTFVSLWTGNVSVKAEKIKNQTTLVTGYIGKKTETKVYEDFENDIWLQYQQKKLEVGQTVDIYPRRVPQIVSNPIMNDVARPNFNFTIIKGEDVISLTETTSNGNLEEGAYDKAEVKAEKEGTAVVQVNYDARKYGGTTYGACSDVNTAYVVFTVGEKGTATIETNDEFANWRHYDTIYYSDGETVPYDFTVNTENAKSVKVTVNGIEIQGNGDKYTANLENRSNIIGIEATDADGHVSSMYRIIDARFIEINVKNKVSGDDVIHTGDTAIVSFRGVTMPVYKLATIYNPQFGSNATYISYNNEKLGDFKGQCKQWDLATNNDFEISLDDVEAGDYTFTSGGIHCAWWGSVLGSDLTTQEPGDPNLGAPTCEGVFSVMPDFNLHVYEDGAIPATKITLDVTEKCLYKNDVFQIKATVEPQDCTETVLWSSSDESVAVVDQNGYVTAKNAGVAIITASVGTVNGTCKITVNGNQPSTDDTEEKPSTNAPEQNKPSVQMPSSQSPTTKVDAIVNMAKPKMKEAKISGKSVKLKWKKIKNARKYQIFRSNSKNGKFEKIQTVSRKKTSFVDKKVRHNKKYFYKVRAYRMVKGKKVFSSFSKVIAVKVR